MNYYLEALYFNSISILYVLILQEAKLFFKITKDTKKQDGISTKHVPLKLFCRPLEFGVKKFRTFFEEKSFLFETCVLCTASLKDFRKSAQF